MLIKCPECQLQVSDRAVSCPHCGYPMKKTAQLRPLTKRKRLPNGFGQISFIKGRNLRNPYRAMVTISKTIDGKPLSKLLKPKSYFPTYNDAYAALVEYNRNPYDLDSDTTVEELYKLWSKDYFKAIKPSSRATIENVWRYCHPLYKGSVRGLRAGHIRNLMDTASAPSKNGEMKKASPTIQLRIKSLFNQMLDYAVDYEMVDKNVAKNFSSPTSTSQEVRRKTFNHISFTDSELELFWKNAEKYEVAELLLVQCYMGWRPSELCELKISDVDLENNCIKGGMKTSAGTNRIVPIHSKVMPIIEKYYGMNKEYLFTIGHKKSFRHRLKLSYDLYNSRFKEMLQELGLSEHRLHDGRKTFVTMAKKYNVDEYAIKLIVGHYINDLTERVYTHRDLSWLKQEIEKIK